MSTAETPQNKQVLPEVDAAVAVQFQVESTRQGVVDQLDQPTNGFEQVFAGCEVAGADDRQNRSRRAPERMPSKARATLHPSPRTAGKRDEATSSPTTHPEPVRTQSPGCGWADSDALDVCPARHQVLVLTSIDLGRASEVALETANV
jgi:hypothetical protein